MCFGRPSGGCAIALKNGRLSAGEQAVWDSLPEQQRLLRFNTMEELGLQVGRWVGRRVGLLGGGGCGWGGWGGCWGMWRFVGGLWWG
jgi:hypothetical protein